MSKIPSSRPYLTSRLNFVSPYIIELATVSLFTSSFKTCLIFTA